MSLLKRQIGDEVVVPWGTGKIIALTNEFERYIVEGYTDWGKPFIDTYTEYEILNDNN